MECVAEHFEAVNQDEATWAGVLGADGMLSLCLGTSQQHSGRFFHSWLQPGSVRPL